MGREGGEEAWWGVRCGEALMGELKCELCSRPFLKGHTVADVRFGTVEVGNLRRGIRYHLCIPCLCRYIVGQWPQVLWKVVQEAGPVR